jgi:small subunit ribosomal protein S21
LLQRISLFKYFGYLCAPAYRQAGLKSPKGGIYYMLIIDSKDCENIDKALKKYKKKFEKSKILLQLRERQAFIKPSIRRRKEVLKAVYKEQVSAGKFD